MDALHTHVRCSPSSLPYVIVGLLLWVLPGGADPNGAAAAADNATVCKPFQSTPWPTSTTAGSNGVATTGAADAKTHKRHVFFGDSDPRAGSIDSAVSNSGASAPSSPTKSASSIPPSLFSPHGGTTTGAFRFSYRYRSCYRRICGTTALLSAAVTRCIARAVALRFALHVVLFLPKLS